MSQPLPVCTAQRARATKGRCVPPRCPDRQTERRMCMHLAASLASGTRSLRGRGSSGVTLARPGRGGLHRCCRRARATRVARPRWRPRQVSGGARARLSALRAPRPARIRGNPRRPRAPPQVAAARGAVVRHRGRPPAAVMRRSTLHPLLEESLESYLVPVTFLRSPSHQSSVSSCFSPNCRV